MFDVFELIQKAWAGGGYRVVKEASLALDNLKWYTRICVDTKLLSLQQFEFSVGQTSEVGKMLGGWMNSLKNK